MLIQKISQFLVVAFAFFTLTACGGKSTKQDAPATEAETRCCDKEKCDGKCDKHDKPTTSPESAANLKPNDGTAAVGDVTTCPVSGDVFTVSAESPKTEIDGKTYYFCCAGCVDTFTADPDKFLKEKPKVAPESAASMKSNDGTRVVGDVTKCVVSGNALTIKADTLKTTVDGKTYYFCCKGCVGKFEADPAKYL